MQTLTLQVNESVQEKFSWLLSHFDPSEVKVIDTNRFEFINRLKQSEDDIEANRVKDFDFETFANKLNV